MFDLVTNVLKSDLSLSFFFLFETNYLIPWLLIFGDFSGYLNIGSKEGEDKIRVRWLTNILLFHLKTDQQN